MSVLLVEALGYTYYDRAIDAVLVTNVSFSSQTKDDGQVLESLIADYFQERI